VSDFKVAGSVGMPIVQLTTQEAEELHSILEGYFSELRMEIERTENGTFRAKLQDRERFVRRLLEELKH
jgi:hypothetical protein